MKKQAIAAVLSILLGSAVAPALAAERPVVRLQSGFYGGVVLRDQGIETQGIALGTPGQSLATFGIVPREDALDRSLYYGGYRFGNDVAVEASFNATDPHGVRANEGFRVSRGLGLVPAAGSLAIADSPTRTWNVDVYTSWNFYRSFALYGRLGYAQTDGPAALGPTLAATGDPRRLRDGLNYGLGVRYDMTSSLGLRLEYGRFGRFSDVASPPQDTDQVTFGLQFRF